MYASKPRVSYLRPTSFLFLARTFLSRRVQFRIDTGHRLIAPNAVPLTRYSLLSLAVVDRLVAVYCTWCEPCDLVGLDLIRFWLVQQRESTIPTLFLIENYYLAKIYEKNYYRLQSTKWHLPSCTNSVLERPLRLCLFPVLLLGFSM